MQVKFTYIIGSNIEDFIFRNSAFSSFNYLQCKNRSTAYSSWFEYVLILRITRRGKYIIIGEW